MRAYFEIVRTVKESRFGNDYNMSSDPIIIIIPGLW